MTSEYDELPIVEDGKEGQPSSLPRRSHLFGGDSSSGRTQRFVSVAIIVSAVFVMYTFIVLFLSSFRTVGGAAIETQIVEATKTSQGVPDYFQTTPGGAYEGPTATGPAAFLAETNPAPFPSKSFIPVAPLETQVPIEGNTKDANIFQLHGELSHYFPNPDGFGIDELALPAGSNISYLYMLHRHGARYPTTSSAALTLAAKLEKSNGRFDEMQALSFLNTWENKLGAEILVPVGKQELFDSGILHQYMYGHLYPNNGNKIIVRSTTQNRMTESAEYFLSGFFGLQWPKNATLELIIEENGFNNSLAGYFQCPNSNKEASRGGQKATYEYVDIYLADAAKRFNTWSDEFVWTPRDAFAAQMLCAYETVALGFSSFCGLFNFEEWLGYEYATDISFSGNNAFESPTGRAVGIGWVQELLARLKHQTINKPTANVNYTLDSDTATFPIDQALNLDFSHDTNIMAIITALGFTQFAKALPIDRREPHELIVSHITPFAARLDIEVISAPEPVSDIRTGDTFQYKLGEPTQYIHFLLNQRTLPLGRNFPECGNRTDGWCELSTFLKVQEGMLERSQYDYACFGEYDAVPYGQIKDGVPFI